MDQQSPSVDCLLNSFFNGTATAAEKEILFRYLQDPENDAILKQWIEKINPDQLETKSFPEGTADAMLQAIFQAGNQHAVVQASARPKLRTMRTAWRWYAAAVVLIIAGATYFFLAQQQETKTNEAVAATETGKKSAIPIPAGTDKAVLVLDNGRQIELDNKGNQLVDAEFGTSISRNRAMLDYTDLHRSGKSTEQVPQTFHTLSTPKGGQYQLTLPDGSLVWLNAASSIRFPTSFAETREVEIQGEVYIEVQQNKSKPFIIHSNGLMVQVLGTALNLNAYANEEASKITLVNGSVKVQKANAGQVVLQPGQQALLYPDQQGRQIQVKQVDVQQQIAWKNGMFSFKSTDIAALMRQMERWYNVDVVYPKGVPADRFSGTIPRSANLNQFLEILRLSDIKATVEGQSVIIKP